jgi:SAM-dependent methyltransferase
MLRVLRAAGIPRRVLDAGCGSGVLLAAVLNGFPEAEGLGVDYSAPMLESARGKLAPFGGRAQVAAADLAAPGWQAAAPGPYDAVVSGYCIHHLPDDRKLAIYGEIFALLAPGGVFFHAEHVASDTPELEALFDDAMTEHLYRRRRERGEEVTLEQVRRDFLTRPDRAANLLAPLETQLAWLRDLGFIQVDCYWKWFELALFGGVRPA